MKTKKAILPPRAHTKNSRKIMLLMLLGILLLLPGILSAQQGNDEKVPVKFALVIGNGSYSGLAPLSNPLNDANDIAAVLEHLGFSVDKILDGDLVQMEDAVERLRNTLALSDNAYGFFYYAGHGVQSGGDNYLIPVDANIPNENYLRTRAVSVQAVLDDLNDARNALNVVVLDACRDNPFGWSRSGTRGLAIVGRQPSDSIIVYATSAGQRASDGDGRNGLFTGQLINNLATPGIDVSEVFRRTGSDVARISNNSQVPAIYSQFFGIAYLGDAPLGEAGYAQPPSVTVIIGGSGQGQNRRESDPAKFWSVGASIGSSFAAPWLIGTAYGTIAPLKFSFLELGFDIGLLPLNTEVNGYYSLYPFANIAFFWPFTEKLGAFAGAGGGLYFVSYKIEGFEDYKDNFFAADFTAGVKLFNMLNISYSLRSNFKGVSHKVSAGYIYRFK